MSESLADGGHKDCVAGGQHPGWDITSGLCAISDVIVKSKHIVRNGDELALCTQCRAWSAAFRGW